MAAIVISSPGGAQTNPTNLFLPFNRAGVFVDSSLYQFSTNGIYTVDTVTGATQGLYIDNGLGNYQFGDLDSVFTGASIQVPSNGNISITAAEKLILNANASIEMNGLLTDVSAGGSAGLHLKLTINDTRYKIQLLND